MICLDTSVLIDLLKNNKEAVEKIKGLGSNEIIATRINIFEILLGVFCRGAPQKFSEDVRSLTSSIKILELDEVSCIQSARIKSGLVQKGREIETTDCLIAGIMLANGCNTIITKNKEHFSRIEGIKIESY